MILTEQEKEIAKTILEIASNPEVVDYNEKRKLIEREVDELVKILSGVVERDPYRLLFLRQIFVLSNRMKQTPAAVLDIILSVIYDLVSTLTRWEVIGREVPMEDIDFIERLAGQFKVLAAGSGEVFSHTRASAKKIIDVLGRLVKQEGIDKEKKKKIRAIMKSLEAVRAMTAEEVIGSMALWEICYSLFPVAINKNFVSELSQRLQKLYSTLDYIVPMYRQVLQRPVYRDIERPLGEDLGVWKHYWELLISQANRVVANWGWGDVPPINIVLYTGVLVEEVSDAFAYVMPPVGGRKISTFVVNMPIARRGSSPADFHIVTHEVTPGHHFHISLLGKEDKRKPLLAAEDTEISLLPLPLSVSKMIYEGWAVFAQYLFGRRYRSSRYWMQWFLELHFYLQRILLTVGGKVPDDIHVSRLSNPLQLASYFCGFLLWYWLYNELKDDDNLLEYIKFGRFPAPPYNEPEVLLEAMDSILSEVVRE